MLCPLHPLRLSHQSRLSGPSRQSRLSHPLRRSRPSRPSRPCFPLHPISLTLHPSSRFTRLINLVKYSTTLAALGTRIPVMYPNPTFLARSLQVLPPRHLNQTPLNPILPTRSLRPLHLHCLRQTLPLSILSKCSLQPLQHLPDPK